MFCTDANYSLHTIVCKVWMSIVNSMTYQSLTIVKKYPFKPDVGCPVRCREEYEPIKMNVLVSLKSADSLLQLSEQTIFKNVKKMTTVFSNFPDFKVVNEFYNNFDKLEDLTFDTNYVPDGCLAANIVLELKSLRRMTTNTEMFRFKTPNLSSLKTVYFDE